MNAKLSNTIITEVHIQVNTDLWHKHDYFKIQNKAYYFLNIFFHDYTIEQGQGKGKEETEKRSLVCSCAKKKKRKTRKEKNIHYSFASQWGLKVKANYETRWHYVIQTST